MRTTKYNPAFLDEQELIDGFVVRQKTLKLITDLIKENTGPANQHMLMIGPRGIGKTTLLLRTAAELRRDLFLSEGWLPITFAEESYQISSCGEFWLTALSHLAEQQDSNLTETYEELCRETDDQRLAERALGQLLDFADQNKKRLLLIVENLHMLIEQLTDDAGWQLRHTLQTEPRIMLLASATSRFDAIDNESKPLFELFRVHELKRLDTQECANIWQRVTGTTPKTQTIRPIEILTGGNPRLITIIARFGAKRSFQELMSSLLELVDEHTEYFKSQLEALPSTERKVYIALIELWEPAITKQIAEKARLPVNTCSSLLKRLVERGAVIVDAKKPRQKTYYVAERMYNIYYLLRSRHGHAKVVQALVQFMTAFYEEKDLVDISRNIAEFACSPDEGKKQEYYLAYEELLKSLTSEDTRRAMLNAAPISFLMQDDMPEYIKNSAKEIQQEDLSIIQDRLIDIQTLFDNKKYEDVCNLLDKTSSDTNLNAISRAKYLPIAAYLKGGSLYLLEKYEESISSFNTATNMLSGSKHPNSEYYFSRSLLFKAIALEKIKLPEKALTEYDLLISQFLNSGNVRISENVVNALINKANIYNSLDRHDEEISTYNTLIDAFQKTQETQILEHVSKAMLLKILSFYQIEKLDAALNEIEKFLGLPELLLMYLPNSIDVMIIMAAFKPNMLLNIVEKSKSRELIQPFLIALQKDQGLETKAAIEVDEVASDILKQIHGLRSKNIETDEE